MKLPAVLSRACIALRRGISAFIASIKAKLGRLKTAVQGGLPHGKISSKTREHKDWQVGGSVHPDGAMRLVIALSLGVGILLASILIIMALSVRRPGREAIETLTETMVPGDVPGSGPALASMLLIPGGEEWPYPLALEPKARYTEADADEMRPDMRDVDISGLTRHRKAELEALFNAVD